VKLEKIAVTPTAVRSGYDSPAGTRHAEVAKAMDYMLKRWPAFKRFLDDGRICLSNNAAERALRGIALGRKAWLFAGSERGGERARDHLHIDPDCQA
jgi:Transposase IS66 family